MIQEIILYCLVAFFILQFVVVIFIVPYFKKKQQDKIFKNQKKLLDQIQPGNEILLTSGIFAKVHKKSKDYMLVEIHKNVIIKISNDAILGFFDDNLTKNDKRNKKEN